MFHAFDCMLFRSVHEPAWCMLLLFTETIDLVLN